MGGRIYDAVIGRMLQADILVQAPTNILSYNRYAYVINNPVNLIDPTGYAWEMSSPYSYSNNDPDNSGCSACGGDGPTDDNLNGSDPAAGSGVDPQNPVGPYASDLPQLNPDGTYDCGNNCSSSEEEIDWDELRYQGLRFLDALPPAMAAPAKIPALVGKAPSLWGRLKAFLGGVFKGPKGAGWKADPYHPNWKKELGPKSIGSDVVKELTPLTKPELFRSVRGCKAKCNTQTGEIWEPDMLHKDHFEVYKNRKNFDKGKRDRSVWDDGRPKDTF